MDRYPLVWIASINTGCQIQTRPYIGRDISFTWTGECRNGNVHGTGKITWYKSGIEYNYIMYSHDSGVVFNDGKEVLTEYAETLIPTLNYTITRCAKYEGIGGTRSDRTIEVTVPSAFATGSDVIFGAIINFSAPIVWQKCPSKSYSTNYYGVRVEIHADNGTSRGFAELVPNRTGRNTHLKAVWGNWNNAQARYWHQIGKERYEAEIERRKAIEEERTEALVNDIFKITGAVIVFDIVLLLVKPTIKLSYGVLKIVHYVFVPYRTTRVPHRSQPIDPKAIIRSMYRGRAAEPPPVYQSDNFARRARALKKRLEAEIELMEAAMIREKVRRRKTDKKER